MVIFQRRNGSSKSQTGLSTTVRASRNLAVVPRPDEWPAFSFNDLEQPGFRHRLDAPTIAIGMGTIGSHTVHRLTTQLLSRLGCRPRSVDCLMIDSAERDQRFDATRFLCLDKNGFGTDPNRGRDGFRRRYREIRATVTKIVERLDPADPLLPTDKPRHELLNAVLIGATGATSGGGMHELVTLVHDMARTLRIADVRVQVVLVGPEIVAHDISKQLTTDQEVVIHDTGSAVLAKFLGDFISSTTLVETPPGELPFSIPAARRIWSCTVVDQTNGAFDFSTVSQLVEMLADALYLRLFTEAGKYLSDRMPDADQLGTSGRGRF